MKKRLPSELRESLSAALRRIPDVEIAVVYGSAAQGRLRPDSDIDIGIAGRERFEPERLVDISLQLVRRIHREIDIIDLRTTRGLVFYEALTKGVVLLADNRQLMADLMKEAVYYGADFLPAVRTLLRKRTGVADA